MGHAGRPVAAQPLRLFFALWPDDATRARFAEWTRAIHRESGGRAMRRESVHLTLAFLGDTEPAALPATEAAATRVTPRAFTLSIDEPGYWRHNQIAWAGAREPPAELGALVADLRTALLEARIPFDTKPFVTHLTLIRKAQPGFRMPRLAPIEWLVRDFVLLRSVTGPDGNRYEVVRRWG
ncbi:MAG TPA: RNA 2',3'-cyclic phosphodiesterase [Burkholderiales bacterium]|nr:RNA 2',3'-cyclic phosphodiesterase [Burkholderiales bacterium]